jgi:hypothetical protein
MTASLFAAEPTLPWQRKIRRVGQTNMTEHDPAVLDVDRWAKEREERRISRLDVGQRHQGNFCPEPLPDFGKT